MKNSAIEWTHHTFNPWIGCTKVSPACDNCYAEKSMPAKFQKITWGAGQERKRASDANWREPLRWNADCARRGVRERVFCASLADVFDNEVHTAWRADLLSLIYRTPHLDWLLLTKRIGNAHHMLNEAARNLVGGPPTWWDDASWENVWLGATICNQEEANRDIPKLLVTPAAKRFLSIEPMLGPIDLTAITQKFGPHTEDVFSCIFDPDDDCSEQFPYIDWVICGGESGPNTRPMHPDWARSLRDQCEVARTPFFFKQWGNWRAASWFDGPEADADAGDDFVDLDRTPHLFKANDGREWDTNGGRWMYPPLPLGHWCLMVNEGKKAAGRLLDGREWSEVPGHTTQPACPPCPKSPANPTPPPPQASSAPWWRRGRSCASRSCRNQRPSAEAPFSRIAKTRRMRGEKQAGNPPRSAV